jgi:ABC-type branched-subunit amino acid transport system ATPase component
MAKWALDLENVRAGYGETVVLEDICIALGASETVSIIGRNGVGKTTLLATIMGHTTLHGGRLSLHDNDISKMATYRRVGAGLGYVPQEREIFPSLRCGKPEARGGRGRGRSRRVRAFPGWRSVPTTAAISFRRRAADAGDRPR